MKLNSFEIACVLCMTSIMLLKFTASAVTVIPKEFSERILASHVGAMEQEKKIDGKAWLEK